MAGEALHHFSPGMLELNIPMCALLPILTGVGHLLKGDTVTVLAGESGDRSTPHFGEEWHHISQPSMYKLKCGRVKNKVSFQRSAIHQFDRFHEADMVKCALTPDSHIAQDTYHYYDDGYDDQLVHNSDGGW